MPESMSYRIGAVQFGLDSDTPGGSFDRVGRFTDFSAGGLPDLRLLTRCGKPAPAFKGVNVFESGQSWRMAQDGSWWMLYARSKDLDPYLAGVFAEDFRSGEIYAPFVSKDPETYIFPLGYPLGQLFTTNLLGTGLGVMLHACGLVDHGSGLVFAGVSTAGKTTTAHLWEGRPGVQILSDDHILVRKVAGQFRLFGTPWHGQGGMVLPLDAPLERIYVLKHASQNQVTHLTAVQAATSLLVRSFSPLWSQEGMRFTLDFLTELCQALPCFELGFVPDNQVVDFVRCLST